MGASQEKKKRIEAVQNGTVKVNKAEQEELKKAKKFKTVAIIVLVVVIVCAGLIVLFRSNYFYQNATAVTIDGVRYSISDFNYFRTVKISEYEKYFGEIESMTDLVTADIIDKATIEDMEKMTMYNKLAAEAGYTLSEKSQEEIDSGASALATFSSSRGMTLDQYLQGYYGKGVTEAVYKKDAALKQLAQEYHSVMYDSFSYTDEELEAEYDPDEDDIFIYNLFSVYRSSLKDEMDEPTGEDCLKRANEFYDKLIAGGDFGKLASECSTGYYEMYYSRNDEATLIHNRGSSLNDTYSEWLRDPARKEGDCTVFSDDVGAYVVRFIGRDDNNYNPVTVREIAFEVNISYGDYESNEEYANAFEEKRKACVVSAETMLSKWQEGEMTEESFAKLADAYNVGNVTGEGGLMDIMVKGAYYKTINDWCYDEARKPGDVQVIETPMGGYIFYFVGKNPQTYRQYIVDKDMREIDFGEWEESAVESYEGVKSFFFRFANGNAKQKQA